MTILGFANYFPFVALALAVAFGYWRSRVVAPEEQKAAWAEQARERAEARKRAAEMKRAAAEALADQQKETHR